LAPPYTALRATTKGLVYYTYCWFWSN